MIWLDNSANYTTSILTSNYEQQQPQNTRNEYPGETAVHVILECEAVTPSFEILGTVRSLSEACEDPKKLFKLQLMYIERQTVKYAIL